MPVSRIEQHGRDEERQEYRIRCSDAAGPGRQDHGRDEQAKKLIKFPHMTEVGDSRSLGCSRTSGCSGRIYR